MAAALPRAGFVDDRRSSAFARPPGRNQAGERLAWPAAAAVILGASATLWLGIGAVVRLLLG